MENNIQQPQIKKENIKPHRKQLNVLSVPPSSVQKTAPPNINQKKPITIQKKVSQKSKQPQSVDNKKNKTIPSINLSQKVNFNFKNNQVDKFYCPQMVISKLTKSRPIDLESIPDLPEIPLEKLLGVL